MISSPTLSWSDLKLEVQVQALSISTTDIMWGLNSDAQVLSPMDVTADPAAATITEEEMSKWFTEPDIIFSPSVCHWIVYYFGLLILSIMILRRKYNFL